MSKSSKYSKRIQEIDEILNRYDNLISKLPDRSKLQKVDKDYLKRQEQKINELKEEREKLEKAHTNVKKYKD